MKKVRLFAKVPYFVSLMAGLLILGACASSGNKTTDTQATNSPGIQTGQAEVYDGPKARIAVARIQNKSGNNYWYSPSIGDGMADQLTTALFNSKRFIVLERQALDDVQSEQDAGASGSIQQDASAPIDQIEGAELLVVGAVTDFIGKDSGSQAGLGGGVLGAIAGGFQKAHMVIDLRIVDARTSRVLAETTVEGESTDGNLGGAVGPLSGALGGWKNTAVEKALRSVINQSVEFIAAKTPQVYYRHRASSSRGNSRIPTPRSPLVREMQTILNSLGYDAGIADGISGSKTRIAVSVFQRDYGLNVTGKLDSDTVGKLRKIIAR